jgi:serine/threonine-protein kinase
MSPEQAKSPRDVDARSDIYSVGVLLYELLSGRTPFFSESGEFTEILFKLFTAEPPPIKSARPDLPDGLAAVVHHALARDPANRFQDASQLAEALAPYAGPASAQILTRIRAFTSRIMPSAAGSTGSFSPPAQSIVPPSTAMAAIGQEVLAATQLGATDLKAGKEAQRTDLANTRDATPVTTAAKPKALPVWVVVGPVAAVGLAAVAAFVLFRERPVAPSYDLTPPSSTSPYFAVTPPSAAPSPSAAPVPDSTPSASADPSAKSKPPPIVRPPPSRPPGGCVDQPGKPCIKL